MNNVVLPVIPLDSAVQVRIKAGRTIVFDPLLNSEVEKDISTYVLRLFDSASVGEHRHSVNVIEIFPGLWVSASGL